jgi:hypothetical protein
MSSYSTEDENDDYQLKKNVEMKRNYEKNCDLLFATIYKTIKAQPHEGQKFYIGAIDFTNGVEDFTLNKLYEDMLIRSEVAENKNIKARAFSPKALPFTPIRDISITFHSYDIKNVYVFTNNIDIRNFISKKYNLDNIDIISNCSNPMTERDIVHKYAFEYYLSNNIIKRSDSEEMIFGDELL